MSLLPVHPHPPSMHTYPFVISVIPSVHHAAFCFWNFLDTDLRAYSPCRLFVRMIIIRVLSFPSRRGQFPPRRPLMSHQRWHNQRYYSLLSLQVFIRLWYAQISHQQTQIDGSRRYLALPQFKRRTPQLRFPAQKVRSGR